MQRLAHSLLRLAPLCLFGLADAQFTVLPPGQSNGIPPHSPAPLRHWDLRNLPGCSVSYRVNNAGSVDFGSLAPVVAEVDKAFAVWRAVEPAVIDFANLGATAARGNSADGNNVLFWDSALCSGDSWDAGLRGGAIALTMTMSNVTTGIISDVDIVFDDEHFVWNVGTQTFPVNGDDLAAGGAILEGVGGNGVCETQAICDDVQQIAVGAAVAAGAVCVSAGPNGVLESGANLSGLLDIWAIAAHEIGHFCGLGENNGQGTGAERVETREDGPWFLLTPEVLRFSVDGVAYLVALPAGMNTQASVAAAINATLAGPNPAAVASVAGDTLRIDASNPNAEVVVSGGGAALYLGLPVGESGISTMNQLDPRGLSGTDQRSLARGDMDGLNFLYSPDLGDAPPPYPTLVHTDNGPSHLFGIFGGEAGPRYQYEWLGARIDDHTAECEARIPDMDEYDDGVAFQGSFGAGGPVGVDVTVSTGLDIAGNGHAYTALNPLYLNGWFDWNNDGDWDDANEHAIGSAVGSVAIALAAGDSITMSFSVLPPPVFVEGGFARFRLDWGEDVNQVGRVDPSLNLTRGNAQFGEVEDYPIPYGCSLPGPFTYCQTSPNSVGPGALMDFQGSTRIGAADFVLKCYEASNQPGIFYYGGGQSQLPFGNGWRCVAPGSGGVHRLGVSFPTAWGEASWPLDFANPPEPSGQIQPGSTWNFQYWYRDPAGGGSFFNLSDGLQVSFCP